MTDENKIVREEDGAVIDKELIDFLLAQGHSQERAVQIAGNHPDEVREMIAKAKAKEESLESEVN